MNSSSNEIINTHKTIVDAWHFACMILDYEVDGDEVNEFAKQYSLMFSRLNRTLQEADQLFVEAVRTQIIATADQNNDSAHLRALKISKKVATIFIKGELFDDDSIVKHFDWFQKELSNCRPIDRDNLISKMVVEERKAIHFIESNELKWTKWDLPSQWAKVFDISSKTFIRRCQQKKIRHQKQHTKSYRVAIDDLPPKTSEI